MNKHQVFTVALAVSAVLAASVALGQEPIPPTNIEPVSPQRPEKPFIPPRVPHTAVTAMPEEEVQPAQSSNPSADKSPVPEAGTTLSPPVTITYSGSSNAMTIKDSGSNRGLSSTLSSSSNSNSAVYGETNGKGAGVKGINYGTGGPGGIFQVTDSASAQSGLFASTSGTGSAILGTITKSSSEQPAITGQNTGSAGHGIGVEGEGGLYGVFGVSPSGYAVYGSTNNGAAVVGEGSSGTGVVAESENGYGLYAHSSNGISLYSSSDTSYAIFGQSKNQYAVIGEDSGSGVGVYGSSASGYAGFFNGKVIAQSYMTLSDRNAKTETAPVDGSDVLERISQLPITSWTFKSDASHRHLGPMAQDFHAAFGLNGEDDTHINLADSAGVSLVAIQELNKRLKQKDAQIARNNAEIAQMKTQIAEMKAMNDQFSARVAKLEQRNSDTARTATASLKGGARISALSETRE